MQHQETEKLLSKWVSTDRVSHACTEQSGEAIKDTEVTQRHLSYGSTAVICYHASPVYIYKCMDGDNW